MARITILPFLLFSFLTAHAQTFSSGRVTAWQNAGLTTALNAPVNQVDITDFGADNTGTNSCNSAYTTAIADLNGQSGTVYFPAGTYYFTSGISIPDSIFLKGESSETELRFDLGGTGNLIQISGSVESTQRTMSADGIKGAYEIELSDASGLQAGDVIRLFQFDEDHMFSTWAYGTLGQVIEITAINANTLSFSDPLNHNYPLSRNPYVKKLNPKRGAGMECLKIVREDASVGQTSNIYMANAFNCAIRNVESENCNFAHFEINSSAHIQVEGCYFHHAFAYGGGGQGYGQVFQVASSFCLAQNNVYDHLRHSMLIQSGANGNVFGYNYSHDPFWQETTLPSNSAGDAVLHGNYTYLNLFEGNTVQNIVVDASHDKNGPFNTFFRNRAELYGFFSDNSAPTDSMNIVGNEITNSGFPLGLFIVSGSGYYSFGNNVNGTTNPAGTANVTVNSLYLNENDLPDFLATESLPMAGYPLTIGQKQIPAELRFDNNEPVSCSSETVTFIQTETESKELIKLYGNELRVDPSLLPSWLSVYSTDGRMVLRTSVRSNSVSLNGLPTGQILFLHLVDRSGRSETAKFKLH